MGLGGIFDVISGGKERKGGREGTCTKRRGRGNLYCDVTAEQRRDGNLLRNKKKNESHWIGITAREELLRVYG